MPHKDIEERKKYQKQWRERNRDKIKIYRNNNIPARRLRQRKYRKNNPDKFRCIDKEKYRKHKKRILDYSRKRYIENKDEILAKAKIYREKNIDTIRKKAREYYHKNKDKRLAYLEKYRVENKKKIIEGNTRYEKARRKVDPSYRIEKSIRSLLNIALRRYTSGGKIFSSKKYGVDYKAIINHLKPFPNDLNGWHIDHIKPLCSFDLSNPKEVKKAFDPTNHRWLTAEDNIKKSHLDKNMRFIKK